MKSFLIGIVALFLATGTASAQHFFPKVTINGVEVRMVLDTGATNVALSFKDAKRIGLDLDALPKNGIANTANGTQQVSIFVLPEITVEGYVLRNVTTSCCVTSESLLGMSALNKFGGVKIEKGWMILIAPEK